MKNKLSGLLALVLVFCLLGSCAKSAKPEEETVPAAAVSAAEETAPSEQPAAPEESAPIEEAAPTAESEETVVGGSPFESIDRSVALPIAAEPTELSMWTRTSFEGSSMIQSFDEHEGYQLAEELTGIHINFTEVSSVAESEQFNLMIAGGDYADLIYNFKTLYQPGIDNAIEEDIIIDLNEYMDFAPIYNAIRAADDGVRRLSTTDTGKVGSFYRILTSHSSITEGVNIRQDWLEALSLESPVTIDEYHEVLTAFKTEYDCDAAYFLGYTGLSDSIMGAYGTTGGVASGMDGNVSNSTMWVVIDGKMVFGPGMEEFKSALDTTRQWYSEGLIVSDFYALTENNAFIPYVADGRTGVFGMNAQFYEQRLPAYDDQDFKIRAAAGMRLSDEETNICVSQNFLQLASDPIFSVSADCDSPEIAVQWCDFWYSEEGSTIINWGIEGKTYEYDENGEPHWTDFVLNNPDGYSQKDASDAFTMMICGLTAPDGMLSTMKEIPLESCHFWTDDTMSRLESCESNRYVNLRNLSMTDDESTEYATMMADIATYFSENLVKYVIGDLAMADFDSQFLAKINDFGIDRCQEIMQAAYDRYEAR